MKRFHQFTLFILLLGWLSVTNAALPEKITLAQAETKNSIIIDTRPSAFYNGWPEKADAPSGHEPGALNLAAVWLNGMDNMQLTRWLQDHQIAATASIALYGQPEQIRVVKSRLNELGYHTVAYVTDALNNPARLQRLPNFEQLVYPGWVRALQEGKPVTAAPPGEWRILEVAWGAPKQYLLGHIPGANYLDTDNLESEPLWNKVSDDKLKALMAKLGIRHDTTVVLYGRDVYAAARAAQIMLYAGVKDVRLLDGGWRAWSDAGLPTERGLPAQVKSAPDFGAPLPGQPHLMLSTAQAKALLNRQDASLVSIRSWPEFTGQTSGYDYIKPKGDIAGARWGHAGRDATHMEDFHNPDGTMKSADDIAAMWKKWHITPDQQVSFYCGTGWRASEAFIYARAMGWPNISVYDGGWYEWSSNTENPVVSGERGPEDSWK